MVSKARALTVEEGIAVVEEMDSDSGMSEIRGNLKRPSVTQANGSGPLSNHATPRRARVQFEAAVTSLFSSLHHPLAYIDTCITNTANHTSGQLAGPTYTTPATPRGHRMPGRPLAVTFRSSRPGMFRGEMANRKALD